MIYKSKNNIRLKFHIGLQLWKIWIIMISSSSSLTLLGLGKVLERIQKLNPQRFEVSMS
jgi:hypothetical protein